MEGSCLCDDVHWRCIATNGAGRTDVSVLAWEPALFRITCFNIISFSTPPFRIHTLRGLSSVLAFHGAPSYGPIQRLIYMYTHVPPKSCHWLALFFVQLLPTRPCLTCLCNLKMIRHCFMDLAPFNTVTLSFETSKTTYLATHYQIPEDQKRHGFYRMVMSHSTQTSWRHRRKW